MSTGYDSFWMYQNNRHEPVLNLPKNDNYSHAVLTDSYKQMQDGGQPSHFNSYLPPQNNTQSSYPYNQHRTEGSQYVWQSSVYSMPLKPSYVSNFHPQEAISIHSNNVRHSEYSHAQRKLYDYRYLKNVNASVAQVCSDSGKNQNSHRDSVITKGNQNINNQTARIRVKDVFSLNNNVTSKQMQNPILYQTLQNQQPECTLSYGTINHSTTYNSKTQGEYFNYGEGNPNQPNHPPPYYRPAAAGQSQQFSQNSNQLYPQNTESCLQYRANIPRERNFSLEPSQARTDQNIVKNIHNSGNNQESNVQNVSNSSQSLQGNKRVKSTPRISVEINNSGVVNTSGYADLLGVNKTLVAKHCNQNNVTRFQNRRAEIQDTCLSKSKPATAPVSSGSTSVNVKSSAHQLNGRQDTTVIKISIPHSGQDAFFALTDCNSTNENSSLSLPCLLESNEQLFGGWITQSNKNTKENSFISISMPLSDEDGVTNASEPVNSNPPLSCHNPESAYQKTLTVPPRKRFCQVKDPIIGLNKENLDEFINSTPENTSRKVSSRTTLEKYIARETNFQKDITLNALTLKQENCNKGAESPAPEQNVSEARISLEIIKREEPPEVENAEYSAADEDYGHSREESNILEEPGILEEQFSSVVEVTENEISKSDIKTLVLTSEIPESSPEDSENCVQQVENSKDDSEEKINSEKRSDSPAEKRVKERKINTPRKNYKSKINRDKLDMLIQFLEKDDRPGESRSGSSLEKNTDDNTQKRQEVDVNHNRRKLSKTCVVKNKNNSREMISMISNKNARVEITSSSQTSQIVKPCFTNSANSGKGEEIKPNSAEDGSVTDETGSPTEKHVKSNPKSDNQTKAEDSSKSEPKNSDRSENIRETSREPSPEGNGAPEEHQNVMHRIRTLQNLKTVFCKKCNLVLSLDWFWINLVSGELKCLNCFKKMTSKIEENTTESKAKDVRKSETKGVQNDKTESNWANTQDWSNGNDLKEKSRPKGSPQGSKNSKERTKHEVTESPKKNQTANSDDSEKRHAQEHLRKEIIGSASVEQKKLKKEIPVDKKNNLKEESSHKTKHSEDGSKAEMKHGKEGNSNPKDIISGENCKKHKLVDHSVRKSISKEHLVTSKSQKSVRKSSTSKEEEILDHTKREEKETNHSIRKRSESRDSSHKGIEEHPKKEVKTTMNSSEKIIKKSRESHVCLKDNIVEQSAKKTVKHEHTEPKIQGHSKESSSYHKPKEPEQVKPKKSSAPEELKAKSTSSPNNLEKIKRLESTCHLRKRKHSDEDPGAVKVRIVEDHTKRDLKVLIHRTNLTTEDTAKHKNKIADKETQNIKNSVEKFRRNSWSKEEEQSKKEADGFSDSSKAKMALKKHMIHQKSKTQEHAKQKADDALVRKNKEEHGVHKRHEHSKSEIKETVDTSDLQRRKSISKDDAVSPGSHVQDPFKTETKHGGFTAENKDRKKTEEREKNYSTGKATKTLSSEREEQSRKSETASRPLKENQNTKMGNGTKTENEKSRTKDLHEQKRAHKNNAEGSKYETKQYKRIKEKEKSVDDKKKCSDNSERKCQTENRHARDSEEAALGEKKAILPSKEGDGIDRKHSASLLAKLMQKTKKLSWSLLDET